MNLYDHGYEWVETTSPVDLEQGQRIFARGRAIDEYPPGDMGHIMNYAEALAEKFALPPVKVTMSYRPGDAHWRLEIELAEEVDS